MEIKKKLLVDMHIFDHIHQGTRTYLKGLYSAFVPLASNFELYFAACDIQNLKNEFGAHKNVNYIKLQTHNKFYRLLVEIPQIIKKHNIDYSHFQYIAPPFKVNKYIVTTHDILFEQKEFKKYFPLKYRLINSFLFKYSAKRAYKLLTVSEYSRAKISEQYNIPINEIYVTPNAVEDKFEKLSETADSNHIGNEKIILYISRVEPRKNHLLLIKSFLDLKLYKDGYKLVFIGAFDFPSKELLDFLDRNKTVTDKHIEWKQDVSIDTVKRYYKGCEIFVFPSLAEGFGIPVIEAMKFNKKVLISNATAMRDFKLPEELVFDPNNPGDLKKKLKGALGNNKDYSEIYNIVLSNYSWKKSAHVLLDLITATND